MMQYCIRMEKMFIFSRSLRFRRKEEKTLMPNNHINNVWYHPDQLPEPGTKDIVLCLEDNRYVVVEYKQGVYYCAAEQKYYRRNQVQAWFPLTAFSGFE